MTSNILITISQSNSALAKINSIIAGLDNPIGMLIVFAVLLLILASIYVFKYIPKLFHSSNERSDNFTSGGRKEDEIIQNENHSINNQVSNRNYDEIDLKDTELVAVITAAIMAYLGDEAPKDGLVVRSIRKVNKRKHSNNYGI